MMPNNESKKESLMIETDIYDTVLAEVRSEIPKIKGSRFIADVFPVDSVAQVAFCLAQIRKREANASHHCFAYRIEDTNIFRYNDDGEPSGTAGLPILRQIDKAALLDCLVVVTRYYGGVNLGSGGLIRAYGEAAAFALQNVTRLTKQKRTLLRLVFAYADTAIAMHSLKNFAAETVALHYSEDTEMVVSVRCSQAEALKNHFLTLLQGRGSCK
jgi:uncharacterized YigZ family protein